jgi:hypothetical protein
MKKDYTKKLKAQLEMLGKEIDKLKSIAGKEGAESQIKIYKQIEDLRTKENGLREELEMSRQEGEDAWREVKEDVGKTWKSVKSTLKETKIAFKEGLKETKEKNK